MKKSKMGTGRQQRIRRGAEERQIVFIRVGGPGNPRWRDKERFALAKRNAIIGLAITLSAALALLAMFLFQKLNEP
jgi:hypothetical protein